MLNIATCDDEKEITKALADIITDFFKNVNRECNIEEFCNPQELIKKCHTYDIIFLDIQMEPFDGILTAKQIRKINQATLIIYITNYRQYNMRAFEVHAFSYLLKPVKEIEVIKILGEIFEYLDNKEKKNMVFICDEGVIRLRLDDIYYMEYEGRKLKIVSKDVCLHTNYSLKEMQQKLNKYCFEINHKSFLVNMWHIVKIKGFDIEMANGNIVPLAQKKAVIFKEKYGNFLQDTFEVI